MQYPICKVELVMSERQEIEINYCPKCRGIWLDRREIDKNIEISKSSQEIPKSQAFNVSQIAAESGSNSKQEFFIMTEIKIKKGIFYNG